MSELDDITFALLNPIPIRSMVGLSLSQQKKVGYSDGLTLSLQTASDEKMYKPNKYFKLGNQKFRSKSYEGLLRDSRQSYLMIRCDNALHRDKNFIEMGSSMTESENEILLEEIEAL